jgi:plastocyanin
MRPRTPVLLSALAALAVAGAGCGGDDDSGSANTDTAATEATIKTFMYEPDPIEVDAGTTVTWTNEDDILHTVTSTKAPAGAEFDERLDGAGTTAEVSFDEPGTYDYICSVHDGMDGSVVVR